MLTLLSGLTGLAGSIIPELFKDRQDARDKAHELAILDRQIERDKLQHTYRVEEIQVQADTEETKALQETLKPLQAIGRWERFWNGVNASVRPVVSYIFVGEYLAFKFAALYVMMQVAPDMNLAEGIIRSFNTDDMSMFSLIMGFWFGNRAFMKYRGIKS